MRILWVMGVMLIMMTTQALAIDFTQPIRAMDGSPISGNDGKPLEKQPTLGSICESALLAQFPDERDPTGKETIEPKDKFERWKLASKISNAKELSLSAEELALVKKLVGKAFAPLIVGQAWMMLDPATK